MPPQRVVALLAVAGWMLAAMGTLRGQENSPADEAAKAALSAKDLAAFQAFRSLVASQSYQLSDEELGSMVEQHLRNRGDELLHKAPTPADLRDALEGKYQEIYEAMVRRATLGLDPQGKLLLEQRLRDYLQQHGRIRDEARGRYEQYLRNVLPKALEKVNGQMIEAQVSKLHEALVSYLANQGLAAAQIEDALQNAREAELVRSVQQAVLAACDAQLQRSLLADAHTEFASRVKIAVSNGIGQLRAQLEVAKGDPKSQTLEGIEKELRQRLQAAVESQTKKAQSDPLWGAYGTFPLAEKGLPEAASRHFDRRIADAVRRLAEDFNRGSQTIPESHGDAIRRSILADLVWHYDPAESTGRLRPWVAEAVWSDRQWVVDNLNAAARKRGSAFDEDYSSQHLADDVDRLLKAKGEAAGAWDGWQATLMKAYLEKVIPRVREAIAHELAWRYSPLLAGGTWRPGEDEILGLAEGLNRQQLSSLDVWRDRPPGEKQALSETWELWIRRARARLDLGRQAVVGQESVSDELEGAMLARIRTAPPNDAAYWTIRYSESVQSAWQVNPSEAARQYPELFAGTKRKIAGRVALLLKKAAQERLEVDKRREDRQATLAPGEKQPRPLGKPPSADQQEAGPRIAATGKAATISDNSAPSGNGRAGRGEGRTQVAEGSASQRGQPPSSSQPSDSKPKPPAAIAKPTAEYSKILEAQSRIVDLLESQIRSETENARDHGESMDLDLRTRRYVAEATVHWRKSPLSNNAPDLLLPVVQRIKGLIADAWISSQPEGAHGERAFGGMTPSEDRGSGREGYGNGDDPHGLFRFYRIGFWAILFLVLVQSGCWYWNIKYLREYSAARRRAGRAPLTGRPI